MFANLHATIPNYAMFVFTINTKVAQHQSMLSMKCLIK